MDSELDWIGRTDLRRLTGAHPTTIKRWKRLAPAGWMPRWLYLLVHVVHRGRLGEIHAAWRGWMINTRDGELVSPEGLCFTQGQIRCLTVLLELRRALEAEVQRLRAELAAALAEPAVLTARRESLLRHCSHRRRARPGSHPQPAA